MSVSDKESGIVADHITAIEKIAKAQNTFIFIRPTEYDSTVLVEGGFATKSMDIHDKSSNWGPMAGSVPCDQAFCKKFIGTPNPEIPKKVKAHGEAVPIQLFLKQPILKSLIDRKKIEECEAGTLILNPDRKVTRPKTGKTPDTKGVPTHRFFKAAGKLDQKWATEMHFCLILSGENWLVHWVDIEEKGDAPGTLVPLFVWGYKTKSGTLPVTGDYDLWLVAPHMSKWKEHAEVKVLEDVHGNSTASKFTQELIAALNKECKRADNPVFNHGAEAQNYAFTQPIDQKVVMFTPNGTSRLVTRDKLPEVLSDATYAGYIVIWNKRYGQLDPHLMGKSDELESVMKNLRQRFLLRDMLAQFKEAKKTEKRDGKALWKIARAGVLAQVRDKALEKQLGPDRYAIFQFHESLQELLSTGTAKLDELKAGDLPPDYATDIKAMDKLYKTLPKLQKEAVKAAKGGGETDDSLTQWIEENAKELESLDD